MTPVSLNQTWLLSDYALTPDFVSYQQDIDSYKLLPLELFKSMYV